MAARKDSDYQSLGGERSLGRNIDSQININKNEYEVRNQSMDTRSTTEQDRSTHNTQGINESRDKIFLRDYQKAMPKFEFNELVASVFDDMLERSIPFYDEVMNLAIFFIQQHIQSQNDPNRDSAQQARIYDLGSSTGNLLLRLATHLEQHNIEATLCGIDSALAMVERARLKSAALGFEIEFIQSDFLTHKFEKSDIFLAFYTMQFVRPLQRQAMIQKIYDSLLPNGIFLFAEKVISQDSKLEGQMIACYYEYKAKQGYTHKEIYQKREALENVLVPYSVEENCAMLRACGFRHVEIIFKWVNFAFFLAYK